MVTKSHEPPSRAEGGDPRGGHQRVPERGPMAGGKFLQFRKSCATLGSLEGLGCRVPIGFGV